MTDTMIENSDAQEERSQLDVIDQLDIAELRKAAKVLNIEARRDWGKEDFVRAIQEKQSRKTAAPIVFNENLGPKPGYARIVLHRDPTPGHKNSPVQVGVNGRLLHIPRGVQVDVPIPFVHVLNNANTTILRQYADATRENPAGVYKDEETSSYPYQLIAMTPGGDFSNPQDSRSVKARRRQSFADKFGRYPTSGELKEWLSAKINKEA